MKKFVSIVLGVSTAALLAVACTKNEEPAPINENEEYEEEIIYLPFNKENADKALVPEKLEKLGVANADSATQQFFMRLEQENGLAEASWSKGELKITFERFFDTVEESILKMKAEDLARQCSEHFGVTPVRCIVMRADTVFTVGTYGQK